MFGMPTRGELEAAGFDPAAYVEHDRDWYDGSIRGMDAEIGRLVERLAELGLGRRTLLVFTGDHGEEFLEHGRTFHGQSVYGELSDVPLHLLAAGRACRPGATVAETVQTIDVMPTLLELSGLPVPEGDPGAEPPAAPRVRRRTARAARPAGGTRPAFVGAGGDQGPRRAAAARHGRAMPSSPAAGS